MDWRNMSLEDIKAGIVEAGINQGEGSFTVRESGDDEELPAIACLYRGPRGLKCAAGHMFSDEDLATAEEKAGVEMETRGVGFVLEQLDYSIVGGYDELRHLVADLQQAHDVACYSQSRGENFVHTFKAKVARLG